MSKVRAALIGTGGISNSHARALRSLNDRVELVAAVDLAPKNLKKFCDTHQIPKSYQDADEMLRQEQPDLVHICTPPKIHAKLSIAALKAGAWVLCEKPLCASLEELDQIQDAERETGRYCASVFQWRFGAGGKHLNKLIQDGRLGRLLVGICHTLWWRGDDYYAMDWRGTYETELGGCNMTHGIHAMDFFLWQMGEWDEVTARIGTLNHDIEVEDACMAMVRFKNGAMGSIVNSVCSPREVSYLRFDFQEGTAEVSHLYGYENADWTFSGHKDADEAHQKKVEAWQAIEGNEGASHASQLSELLDNRERNECPRTSGDQARNTLEFLSSVFKSAATNQPVKKGSIIKGDPFYEKVYGTLGKRTQ